MSGGPAVSRILILSGVVTILVGVVCLIAVGGWWPLILIAVGASDLTISLILRTRPAPPGPGEAPYARED